MLNQNQGLLAVLGISLLFTPPLTAQELDPPTTQIPTEAENQTLDQGIGANQFSDVDLSDWAFQALDDLVRRYNCIVGYPDGTFRGDESVSRDEFAAGFNTCLQRLEGLIEASSADAAPVSELEDLTQRLQNLQSQLDELAGEVEAIDDRESNLNSSDTTLEAEIEVNTSSSDQLSNE
ncbi:MAG: iron uptake porin [Cyanobacteria bacterium P01_G01_bin.54]